MNKISTCSPFAHLCLWLSPCDDFLNSYHEHDTRTAWALYHTAALTHFTMPLSNTSTHLATQFMLGLITQLCLVIGDAVHNVLISALDDSKPKYCGVNVCACGLSRL